MGLFDIGAFSQQPGWLSALLQNPEIMNAGGIAPSSGFGGPPSGLFGGPGLPQSAMGGGYGGGAFAPQQPPPQAADAMAQAPMGAPQMPQQTPPGIGDRLTAGAMNFSDPRMGLIARISNSMQGLSTGQRTDAQGVAQNQQRATYEALKEKLGHAGAMAAMSNPKVLEEWAKREFAPYGFAQNGGVFVSQDPRSGRVNPEASIPQFHALPQGSAAVSYQAPIPGQPGQPGQQGHPGGITTLQPAGPNFDQASNLRKEVTGLPEVKRYSEALPIYRSMVKSHDKDSAAADLDFVYGVAKIFDPDSVVREGEMKLVGKAQSIPEDVQGFIKRAAFGEGRLTPEARRRILEVADTRMKELKGSYGERTSAYPDIAKRFQVNPADVMPQLQDHPELPPAPAAAAPTTGSPKFSDGATATNPRTGQKVILKNGQWVPMK